VPKLPLIPLAIVSAWISACGGDDGGSSIPPEPTPVTTSVTVTGPTNTVQAGQTLQLTATAKDADGVVLDGKPFEWATGNAAVATVSSTGLITGVAEGQAEVRATTEGVPGTMAVTVTPVPPGPPPPPGPVTLDLQQIATGLRFPTYLTSPPGDSRLFILEKAGAIRVIKVGTVLPTPFLDLTANVNSTGGEQGLLGLAFAPDYATSGRFFVHYNDRAGNNRVSRFQVSADPDRADRASETEVLAIPQPGVAHNGGQLLFGADGMLYIGLGDGDDDDHGRGQSLRDPFGSILRIDVAGSPYTVPPDNPFVGTAGARPEVWSYGLRNPWSFTFDPATGDLYIGDVGENRWEEVNYSSAAEGAGRGVNYGWSVMEGQHCFRVAQGCDQTGLTLPVLEYEHTDGCAVTSGHVYRGAAIPALQGTYFYADYCVGWVKSFRIQGGVPAEQTDWQTLRPGGQITSFGLDAAGELYLVTQQGGLYKIVAG
jgi:glucose/arabinose dehydrogenase